MKELIYIATVSATSNGLMDPAINTYGVDEFCKDGFIDSIFKDTVPELVCLGFVYNDGSVDSVQFTPKYIGTLFDDFSKAVNESSLSGENSNIAHVFGVKYANAYIKVKCKYQILSFITDVFPKGDVSLNSEANADRLILAFKDILDDCLDTILYEIRSRDDLI